MKLMVIFGTRPEVIKLAPVIREARNQSSKIELQICSTGQHREMLNQAMSVFDIYPDIDLAVMRENQSLPDLTSSLIESLSKIFVVQKPDILVVQGDTTTAFASALTAFYHNIPVAHVEAGLRTGNIDSPFPEELNRTLIGRITKWHFAPTKLAEKNLVSEGIDPSFVYMVGNTVVDSIEMIRKGWRNVNLAEKFPDFSQSKEHVLITTHRRENFGHGLREICLAIQTLTAKHPELDFIFPVHLNPNVRRVVFDELISIVNLKLIEPVDFETNLYIQSTSRLIITDSGGIQEEAPTFKVPTIVMREFTERSEGVDAGFSKLTGANSNAIIKQAESYLNDMTIKQELANQPNPYGDGHASERIIRTLLKNKMSK